MHLPDMSTSLWRISKQLFWLVLNIWVEHLEKAPKMLYSMECFSKETRCNLGEVPFIYNSKVPKRLPEIQFNFF